MILPDVNLLVYAYDSGSHFHDAAASWWQRCLRGEEPVGLAPVVLFGFLRITTSPRVFTHPLTPDEAAGAIRSWLNQPVALILDSPPDHVQRVMRLLVTIGTAGNLVTDAKIAALAMAYDAVLHTSDADFLRFPSLRWTNPLTAPSGKRPSPRRNPA